MATFSQVGERRWAAHTGEENADTVVGITMSAESAEKLIEAQRARRQKLNPDKTIQPRNLASAATDALYMAVNHPR